MAVLITGATGFLGTQLAVRFLNEGYDVLATDFTEPSDETASAWAGKVEFVRTDIRDRDAVEKLVTRSGGTDPVVHMAGILTAGCDRDPVMAVDVNMKGLLNVLMPVARQKGRVVVLTSTIGVYGRGLPQPITENMKLEPDGWYGLTKLSAEQMGLLENRRNGTDFRAVRLAAVTGAGRKAASGSASLFTSHIAEMAARGEPYEIEVTPDTAYPVVYIKDAVEALYKLATAPEAPSRIYNISSGRVVVENMVDAVRARIPDARFTYKPVDDIMAVVSGYKEWEIGCETARRELGWTPAYTPDAMVNDIIDVVRELTGRT